MQNIHFVRQACKQSGCIQSDGGGGTYCLLGWRIIKFDCNVWTNEWMYRNWNSVCCALHIQSSATVVKKTLIFLIIRLNQFGEQCF